MVLWERSFSLGAQELFSMGMSNSRTRGALEAYYLKFMVGNKTDVELKY